jgi:hypothetical protein
LLALDNLYRLVRPDGMILLETAIANAELPEIAGRSVAAFYPTDELSGDGSNWFAPTDTCLIDWCESSGFSAEILKRYPDDRQPTRCLLKARPRPRPLPYQRISYERPLRTLVDR